MRCDTIFRYAVPQITEWTQPNIKWGVRDQQFDVQNQKLGVWNQQLDFQCQQSRLSIPGESIFKVIEGFQVEIFAGGRWDIGELCIFSGKLGDGIVDYSHIRLLSSHCHPWNFACPLCLHHWNGFVLFVCRVVGANEGYDQKDFRGVLRFRPHLKKTNRSLTDAHS